MDIQEARKILLQNSEFKREYHKLDLGLEISKMIISARIKRNVTQSKLAELIETGQSSIARIEKGNIVPTLSMLEKIGKALQMVMILPKYVPMEEINYEVSVRDTQDARTLMVTPLGTYTSSKIRVNSKRTTTIRNEVFI